MTETRNLAKAVFIILAMIFASPATANAQGKVNFTFSFNVNGHNQSPNHFFEQVFNNGWNDRVSGHYHRARNGKQYFVKGPHRHNEKAFKQNKKHHVAKLNNKKQLVRHMRKLGYRHVRKIQRSGRFYTVRAISPRGHKVWVKINKRSGQIAAQRVLAWNYRR